MAAQNQLKTMSSEVEKSIKPLKISPMLFMTAIKAK
jgi:hypothetical protein